MKLVSLLLATVSGYEHHVLNSGEGLVSGEYGACLKDAYAGDYLVDWVFGDKAATFEFDPPEDGCYVLEEWHPGMDAQCSRFSAVARLDVDYCKGKSAYTFVDQAENGGRWNILGALPFYVGWPGRVNVSSEQATSCREGSGCFWTADAFRLTKVSGLDVPCQAPESMPAEENPLPEQEEPEVEADSATAHLAVAPVLLDDASLTLPEGWRTESLEQSPLDCGRQGWGQHFAFLDPVESPSHAALELSFEPEADGCYLVEEFHPANVCSKTFSDEVQLTLGYCKGKELTTTVDQSTGGNRWNVLALLPFYKDWPAKVVVKHPQGGAGLAVADGFRFTKIAGSCAAARTSLQQYAKHAKMPLATTLDDSDAEVQGERQGSCDSTALKGSAHDAAQGSAKFSFLPEASGCYRVDEYHPKAEGQCELDKADLTIDYCLGGSVDTTVDLSEKGGQWNPVAHLPFYAGEPGVVTSKSPGQGWVADGVRFVRVSDSCRTVPDASMMTVRLVGVDLKEPEFQEGHLTSRADLRLALHEALVKYAQLAEDKVRLIGLRQGSIIVDFEFAGDGAMEAAEKLQQNFADGSLGSALCAAATVGQENASCSAELLQVTAVPKPESSPESEEQDVASIVGLVVGVSVAAVALISVAAALVLRRRRAAAAKSVDEAQAAEAAEAPEAIKDDDTASTGTPKVCSEVQTDLTGDMSEVASLTSREATQEPAMQEAV